MKWLSSHPLLLSVLAVFAPIKMLIIVSTILVISDTMSGVIAAYKRGEKIRSSGFRRSISKTIVYLSALCLGFLVEKFMIDGVIPISKIVAGAISLTELKSILENLDSINGSSLFKSLIQRLGSSNDKPDQSKSEEKN